jgi:superfamily II RNA helicase
MVKICPKTWSNEDLPEFSHYPYPLSDFQKYAIQGILQNQHILITAHTGSGKTLPAEFAIQHWTQKGKKVIYTSPIKALSNQKYFQFTQSYPHISFGLLTGDIKINPTAQVLLMTTEILMNYLLFQPTDSTAPTPTPTAATLSFQISMDDLAAVVFDEVHYINDKDRGQTWEKTLLTLPPHVQRIMLSATIDSPQVFAQWNEECCRNYSITPPETPRPPHEPLLMTLSDDKRQQIGVSDIPDAPFADPYIPPETPEILEKQVWICSSTTRVVPLTHYAYLTAPQGFYKRPPQQPAPRQGKLKPQPTQTKIAAKPTLTKEQEEEAKQIVGKFLPLASSQATKTTSTDFTQSYLSVQKIQTLLKATQTQVSRPFVLNQLFKQLNEQEMLPAIAFVFSRKNVERFAKEITTNLLEDDSKIPYQASRECEQIIRRLPNYREYLKLPEYLSLVQLLEKGIGIHHSGMIPILREIVELMISQKKIKLLFATESFAIGLDCPIRTVVFTEIRKFDGSLERILLPHEYTQMAGRAGRRGIDTIGNVIHCNNLFELPTKTEYQHLVSGKTQSLQSKFRISYDLVLTLLGQSPQGKTLQEIAQFVKDSMLSFEIQKTAQQYQKDLDNLPPRPLPPLFPDDFSEKEIKLYLLLKQELPQTINKRRKEIQRDIQTLQQTFPEIDTWATQYLQTTEWDKKHQKILDQMEKNEHQIQHQIQQVLDVLQSRDFIHSSVSAADEDPKDKQYILQPLGQIAAPLSEMPSLLFAHALPRLKHLDTLDWILLFSCFTGTTKQSQNQNSTQNPLAAFGAKPSKNDALEQLQQILHDEFRPQISHYQTEELHREMDTGIPYEEYLQPLLAPVLCEWVGCEKEEDCQWVLQQKMSENVSTGDFNKSVLKIIAMAKQLESTLLQTQGGNHEWLEIIAALSKVESKLAKYVISCQSLYV